MTHHPVLICLTTVSVSDSVNDSVNDSVSNTVTKLVYYPFSYVFIEALEPHSIDRVLLSDLSVRQFQIVVSVVVSVVVSPLPRPHVYRELLEPASIDRVLMSDLSVRQQPKSGRLN